MDRLRNRLRGMPDNDAIDGGYAIRAEVPIWPMARHVESYDGVDAD